MGCVKYSLFFFNLICWLAGVALIGVGVAVLMKVTEVVEMIPVKLDAIPISIIVVGGAVFIISFAGCCGAIKESKCLLAMYAIFMTILTAANIGLVYVVMSNKNKVFDEWFSYAFKNHRDTYRTIENAFHCCGTKNATVYGETDIPSHCCDSPQDNKCNGRPTYIGCIEAFQQFVLFYGNAMSYSDLGIIIVQFFAVVAALYMTCTIGKGRGKQFY